MEPNELYATAAKNRLVVKTIAEAKLRIDEATSPTLLIFPSLSLGVEHRSELMALADYGLSKDVIVQFDEADLLQTTDQRLRSAASVFLHGRKYK